MRTPLLLLGFVFVSYLPADQLNLDGADSLELHNVEVERTEYQSKACLRVRAKKLPRGTRLEHLAIISATDFKNGTIELEVAGKPRTDAEQFARGFIGVAFRVQKGKPDNYEAFYLRPTNARAEDQLRRNHSVQYISHPEHPWNKLRKDSPGKYESYTDLVPGEWTKVKVVVEGTDARLFIGGNEQPCLIVKDLKHGERSGSIALWIEPSTDAYFRNLSVSDTTSPALSAEQLVGVWNYVSGTRDGAEVDSDRFEGSNVEFTKEKLTLNSPAGKFVLTYKIDPTATPNKVALEIVESPFGGGVKSNGIIELKDGKLTLCYPPMGGDAPKEFKAEAGSGYHLFELKKEK